MTPAPPATSTAIGPPVRAHARIDDGQHDAGRHVLDAPREGERAGPDVVGRDLVGEVDDGDVRARSRMTALTTPTNSSVVP